MNTVRTLKLVRKAIQDLDPGKADLLLQQLETSGAHAESPRDRRQVEDQLRSIRDLVEASLEGVLSAQSQLKQLLARAQTLDSYDRSGNRQIRDMSIQTVRKF